MAEQHVNLTTPFEEELDLAAPYSGYPRPQMVRDSYLNLNGPWDFGIVDKNGNITYDGKILVPFAPESRLSGVEVSIKKGDEMRYVRRFDVPADFNRGRVLLHFGACDQVCVVTLNGRAVGRHSGGYSAFTFDVTDYLLAEKNVLEVNVIDDLDRTFAYGKQTEVGYQMWYTKVSGIWQTVWLESVPDDYIYDIGITTDLNGVDLNVVGGPEQKCVVLDGNRYEFTGSHIRIDIKNPRLWSPDEPNLYYFDLISGEDVVRSYFGLRTIEVGVGKAGPTILFNGKPTFFHGVLDQGYYPDGIFLPATQKGYEYDVLTMKRCGFNMLRKHIKLEPEAFYYYCDVHGMFVFQDMINNGEYNFLRDTALPTIGIKRGIKRLSKRSQREEFLKQSAEIVNQLKNHPSVVYWTIFNEGWGQFDAKGCYNTLSALDNTRIWDTASGWFRTRATQVISDHVYFKPVRARRRISKPWVLSEFGGYSCKVSGHVFWQNKEYGYKKFATTEALNRGIIDLYTGQIIPAIRAGLCAAVLTQLSDVEEENNGLLTYDRRIVKVDENAMRDMAEKLYAEFDKFN